MKMKVAVPTTDEMLHPLVLKCFHGKAVCEPYGEMSFLQDMGHLSVTFPSILDAARWVKFWKDETGKAPKVTLPYREVTLSYSFDCEVTVTVWNE
jgi:hypothetical protein